ncbi:67a42df0-0309-4031-8e9e-5492d279499f-CDS [Sclerotinia trifoliorum]|uniref:67a42df0-0309-4031-8e9e-5492d279499f-CDS n=1 Tax=Sclerotinia trifoliorum TaxID=28548 RepID=A0A8H2ZT29_9HELO|nr:67a42df0-0309-4031-8e9e-5492d279499f-CDS [Sclerotinia trifoliorum]
MLCKICTDLFLAIRENVDQLRIQLEENCKPNFEQRVFEHHASYDAFQDAVSIGFRLCRKVDYLAKVQFHGSGYKDFRLACLWHDFGVSLKHANQLLS